MSKHVYGIDFGSDHLKIYDGITKKLLNERNMIAKKGKEVLASGDQAYEMFEKAPKEISVISPMSYGVVADIGSMSLLFEEFFKKINAPKKRKSGDFCIAIPTDISEVEKRAFYDLIADSKIKSKDIVVVEKPVADAVGLGIDMDAKKGAMIVNMGAETTEISVVSQGGIVLSKILRFGGKQLELDIIEMVKKRYNLVIGQKSAEVVKIDLLNASPQVDESNLNLKVVGRNVISGLPSEKVITADMVNDACESSLLRLLDEISGMIERTPPEITLDLESDGIYLTGGSSSITNLSKRIQDTCMIKVNTVRNPALSVANGMAMILANPKLKWLLYTPREDEY